MFFLNLNYSGKRWDATEQNISWRSLISIPWLRINTQLTIDNIYVSISNINNNNNNIYTNSYWVN